MKYSPNGRNLEAEFCSQVLDFERIYDGLTIGQAQLNQFGFPIGPEGIDVQSALSHHGRAICPSARRVWDMIMPWASRGFPAA